MNRIQPMAPMRAIDPFEDDSTDIVAFPPSVQRRLDQAQRLLQQDRPSEAVSALQAAGQELARTSPELFVLASLAGMGARSLTFEESAFDTRTVTTERYAFGVRYGREVVTTVTGGRKVRRITLG